MAEGAWAEWKGRIRWNTRFFRPALLATFFLAGSVAAEPPRRLGDFATGRTEFGPRPHGFLDVGGITVYADDDPASFTPALWRTDGTAAGTRALTAFTGSQAFAATYFLRPIGGSLYFLADDGSHGRRHPRQTRSGPPTVHPAALRLPSTYGPDP